MKKIPTLFEREFEGHNVVHISDKVTPGFEWVLEGDGIATVKYDGACCAVYRGELYKRYDAKKGKKPPEGAIPCCPPDPVTGHWPHWVKCSEENPADKWFWEAYRNCLGKQIHIGCFSSSAGGIEIKDATYEALGPHFQGNPYHLSRDTLLEHGKDVIEIERTFEGIREYLLEHEVEGIVFWRYGAPQCKIKRTDFGFLWPVVKEQNDG